jgi:hypothetical protein
MGGQQYSFEILSVSDEREAEAKRVVGSGPPVAERDRERESLNTEFSC